MDENLRFRLGRKSIGCLVAMCLVSGPTGGKEVNNKQEFNLFDLLRLRPVLKTVMLTAELKTAPAAATRAIPQKTSTATKVSAIKEKDEDCYQVRWGDTCWSIARRHGMKVAELTALNPGLNPEKIKSGDYLQVRRIASTSRGLSGPRSIPVTAGREPSLFQAALFHPLRGARLTSGYGMRWGRLHRGIDLAAAAGTPIHAAASGTVTYAGWQSGYGLLVIVDHGAYHTKYAHNAENLVCTGDDVLRGQPVAKVGRTGNATGNHLHFELVFEGEALDPVPYLR